MPGRAATRRNSELKVQRWRQAANWRRGEIKDLSMRRLGSESRKLLGRLELDPRVTVATGILKRDSEESRLYDSDATGVVFQTVQSSVPTLAPVSKFSQNVKVVLSYRAHASCAPAS